MRSSIAPVPAIVEKVADPDESCPLLASVRYRRRKWQANPMMFSVGLPGLMRYPPSEFRGGDDNWQEHLTSEDFQRIAQTTEELGYDAITSSEHMVMPVDLVPAMGSYWVDALTAMTFVAGATKRLRVNSSVIVLPYHEPIAYAKAISTLDVLCGGRVTVTFGVGMARGEFAALGVPFARRGRITDEYIEVLKILWTAEKPEYHGEFVDFADVDFEPKPLQKPHPPIWIGGSSMPALLRAARVGDGWYPSGSQGGNGPWLNSVKDLPAFLAEARKIPGFAEREADFEIAMPVSNIRFGPNHEPLAGVLGPPVSTQEVIDRIAELQDAGVDWTSIPRLDPTPVRSLEEYLEGLEWAAKEVMPAFR
jgi:probable F420-dependent oxidoreductase